jgi:hypothetical protein
MLYGISALTAIFGVGAWVFGRVVESRSAACDSGSNRIGAGEAAYVAAVAHQNDVRLDRMCALAERCAHHCGLHLVPTRLAMRAVKPFRSATRNIRLSLESGRCALIAVVISASR